jgi:hypothetical protein
MSKITRKIIELLELGFGLTIIPEDAGKVQYEVEAYGLENVEDGIIIEFLDLLISKQEHIDPVKIYDSKSFSEIIGVLAELNEKFNLKICDYGEWMLWHLPKLGYGLYIQREASPEYFWTEKRLLELSCEDAINSYSFRKKKK